jgi:hypothetical protein
MYVGDLSTHPDGLARVNSPELLHNACPSLTSFRLIFIRINIFIRNFLCSYSAQCVHNSYIFSHFGVELSQPLALFT